MLPPILLCRASSPKKVANSMKDYNKFYEVPPALGHSFSRQPNTPPPTDEATTYESVLTCTPTPTPTHVTHYNPMVTVVVSDLDGRNTELENSADDVSIA